MPVYRFKALHSSEKMVAGVIDASNPKDARMQLLKDNMFLLDLASASTSKRAHVGYASKKKADELALVTRQFATLSKAGIPIADALEALVDVIQNPKLQITFRDIKENVTQGMSLADALERHPRYFSPFYVSMVKVGEASGNMDQVLIRLAKYLHNQARVRTRVRNAMTYPLLMMGVGVLVVWFLVTFIVPRITDVLVESGRTLPTPTTILIGVSTFLEKFWWALGLGLVGLYALYRTIVATEGGRMARDTLVVTIPVFGELIKKSLVSRFSLTFATLLKSGLPAVESLSIVKETVKNKLLEKTIGEIHDRIIEGQDISGIMRQSGVFPPLVAYMIAVGEESGRLEEMLTIINEYYDEEIEAATARFTSILEPIMIIALAAIVGFVVLAVILPIMEMGELI